MTDPGKSWETGLREHFGRELAAFSGRVPSAPPPPSPARVATLPSRESRREMPALLAFAAALVAACFAVFFALPPGWTQYGDEPARILPVRESAQGMGRDRVPPWDCVASLLSESLDRAGESIAETRPLARK